MKKFFSLVVALATMSMNASAFGIENDDDDDKVVYVTPHFEIGWGFLSNNDSWKNMTFGGIGCDVEFKTCELVGVSVGADFNSRLTGYKRVSEVYGNYGSGFRIRERFNFFNFPVLAQFHIGGGLVLKGGIQAQLLAAAKVSYQGGVVIKSGSKIYDIPILDEDNFRDYYKTFTMAVPVGVSYTFPVPITVDLRYNIPIMEFSKNTMNANQYLSSLMLSIGYTF